MWARTPQPACLPEQPPYLRHIQVWPWTNYFTSLCLCFNQGLWRLLNELINMKLLELSLANTWHSVSVPHYHYRLSYFSSSQILPSSKLLAAQPTWLCSKSLCKPQASLPCHALSIWSRLSPDDLYSPSTCSALYPMSLSTICCIS